MKYFLIAGERSGDLHGANLIAGLRRHDPQAEIVAYGGEQMQAAGATLRRHYRDMAFMGFWEVLTHLPTIAGILRACKADVRAFGPDVLILIDFAGFNLRMAAFAHAEGLPVYYYISPKIWAWNQRRALKIKAVVSRMFCIFPFEVDFYRKYHYEAEYVGNPLMDALSAFRPDPHFRSANHLSSRPIIALLPGSRAQEVKALLGPMAAVAPFFPDYQFVVAGVSNLPAALYAPAAHLPRVTDAAYDLLHVADAAVVASGTATLETALLRVPEVVVYRTSPLTYQLAKRLVRVGFLSLVNLIMQRKTVTELIQDELTTERLRQEVQQLLDPVSRKALLADYERLAEIVGPPGASERAAAGMVAHLRTATGKTR